MKDGTIKGRCLFLCLITPGWGSEKILICQQSHLWHSVQLTQSLPLHLAWAKEEVMKRGETAVHRQVSLLPIALWLRMDSASKGNSICSVPLVEKNLLSYLISPFEVLFQWVQTLTWLIPSLDGREARTGGWRDSHSLIKGCSGHLLWVDTIFCVPVCTGGRNSMLF